MSEAELLGHFLDSIRDPFLFTDTEHTIRYMNTAAAAHYKQGRALLGTSLLDCHNAKSQAMILEILEALRSGEEERLISEDAKRRIYMRAVRDAEGTLLGYFERYGPVASG